MGVKAFHVLGKKIIGVGSNYRSHIAEMGSALPKEPIFFLKPTSSYVIEPNPIRVPSEQTVHHEVELGVIIGRAGANIRENFAMDHIGGYCLALDLTARDIQTEAKRNGLPWTMAKGYDTFCPVSPYVSKNAVHNPHNLDFWLRVNGELKQKGNTNDMIFTIPQLISRISEVMRLEVGDLILTGTPGGVGPIKVGDTITAGMAHDFVKMRFKCVPKPKALHK